MALITDMSEENFKPDKFLNDEDDIEQCKNILKEWFHEIQICHVENLSASWKPWKEDEEPGTYPEVS